MTFDEVIQMFDDAGVDVRGAYWRSSTHADLRFVIRDGSQDRYVSRVARDTAEIVVETSDIEPRVAERLRRYVG